MTRERFRQGGLNALEMRARIAELETTNLHLTKKIAELAFLSSAAARLGSTLDRDEIARVVIDEAATATNARARPRFLLLRVGNTLVYGGGAMIDSDEAAAFVRRNRDALERCLRVGEAGSFDDFFAVPIPGDTHEPGLGWVVVRDTPDRPLRHPYLRRLAKLAELAGRSMRNARLLSQSITAGVTDELTGVYNRRYFDRRLSEELKRARRLGERMALILLDLDYFKAVNDRFGHPEGDRTLCAVAEAIVRCVRDIDVVTRWGGEEFAVVLPGADGEQAICVAERIRTTVQELRLLTAASQPFAVTVSCGVAWSARHIHTPAQCVAAVDGCLLEAKRQGRNRSVSMQTLDEQAIPGRIPDVHEQIVREHRGAARNA